MSTRRVFMQRIAAASVVAAVPARLNAAMTSGAGFANVAATGDAPVVAFYLDQLCLMPGRSADVYRPPAGLRSAQTIAELNDEELAHYVYRI